MKKGLLLLVLFTVSFSAFAQVKISGEARIRPRYDLVDKTGGGGSKTNDFYYMYRARLRFTADIDDGWFFNTMLSHNGIFDYSAFSRGDYPDNLGVNQKEESLTTNESSRRATLSFMELFFGKEVKQYGVRIGLLPLGSIANPLYDLQFYPSKMVDIPFAINNTDGAFGAAGYVQTDYGKFGAKAMVEDQRGIYEENAAGVVKRNSKDAYTFELNYSTTQGGFVIAPMALVTVAQDSVPAPSTFGLSLSTPKVMDLTFSTTFGYSVQNHANISKYSAEPGIPSKKYNAWLLRVKAAGNLGGGNLLAWVDVANRTEKIAIGGEDKYKYMYYWLGYEYFLHKSDKGSVSVTPEIRYATETKNSNKNMSRLKAEMNIDIKF